jgi:Rrf2 family protein
MRFLPDHAMIAIAAICHIAINSSPEGEKACAGDICRALKVKQRYLETFFQGARRAHLLRSVRGPKGGYTLATDAELITVADVLRVIDDVSTASDELSADPSIMKDAVKPMLDDAFLPAVANLKRLTIADICLRPIACAAE